MSSNRVSIRIDRDDIGFSAAHFTLFSASHREGLHGHNFVVGLEISAGVEPDGMIFDYRLLKSRLRQLCGELDERMLVPTGSAHLQIQQNGDSVQCTYGNDVFVFPRRDVVLLDLPNVTLEALAEWFMLRILDTPELPRRAMSDISVFVGSSRGQKAKRHMVLP